MEHIAIEELAKQLAAAEKEVEVGARYVHYKNPTKEYVVTGLAVLEATDEIAVLYKAHYAEHVSFVRPLKSFCAMVDVEGVPVPRFVKR